MPIKIVLDASVLIDFDTPNVDLVDTFIKFTNENNNIQIIMSEVNFDEVENGRHSKMKRKLTNTSNFSIKPLDRPAFDTFSAKIKRELNLIIQDKDRAVLFQGVQENATFISTSDTGLYERILEYRQRKDIHSDQQIKPITTVGILDIMFETGSIDSSTFFEKSLALFKFKEIDSFFKQMVSTQLKVEGEQRNRLIQNNIDVLKERFQFYKDPLVDAYRQLKSEGKITV